MNSCDYVSGDWVLDCSENCVIIANVGAGGNNISIIGTGTFVTSANITNYGKLYIRGTDPVNICRVRCINGGDVLSLDASQLSGSRQADGSLPAITFGHLASGSDLINAGVNVDLSYSGSAPDIGAYETNY